MNNRKKIVRATLIELWTRVVKYDKKDKIYESGYNNLYPNEIERVVLNSSTARRSQRMMSKFIAGKGVVKDYLVNKKKHIMLSQLVTMIADDVSTHYGSFIHAGGYQMQDDGRIVPTSFDVLDYTRCRIGRVDDNDNEGLIHYKNFEEKSSRFSGSSGEKAVKFLPFTTDQTVIIQQINDLAEREDLTFENALERFKGHVMYLNLTPRYRYAISPFDSVFNDCDTEYRIGLYDNTMTRGGFLGKTAVLTQGLDDEKVEQIVTDIQKWLGAENSSSIYHLGVETADDLNNILKIIQVNSQYDGEMFVKLQERVRRNILGAANNIPETLAFSNGAMFGTSGEEYMQTKLFYVEQTESERLDIENALKRIGLKDCEIIPFTTAKEVMEEEVSEVVEEADKVEIENEPEMALIQ